MGVNRMIYKNGGKSNDLIKVKNKSLEDAKTN